MTQTTQQLVIGGHYRWKHDHTPTLIYLGYRRYPGDSRTWYEFSTVDHPDVVWCEILQDQLHLIEAINYL